MDESKENFDLAETVGKIAHLPEFTLRNRPVILDIDCPSDSGTIFANRAYLEKILVELLCNARKFTEAGTIRLEVRRKHEEGGKGDVVTLAVTDTGCGIPSEWFEWIFKPREIRKIHPRRNGIGLFVVQSLCHRIGAEVSVKSEVGKGSTFTVALPLECARRDSNAAK